MLFTIVNGLPADQLDKPHKWVPAEQCAFVNPPVVPYYWDPSCNSNRVSLGCWADGVHNECRFCGEEPYTGIHCPSDAIVPSHKKCEFDNPPINTYYWEPECTNGTLGCLADGKNWGCRWCGFGDYSSVTCPSSTCTFDNEPVTPYYWDSLCEMGMLGCNADGIHVQCRFCDHKPFNSVHCPPSARPNYQDGECWFPQGTAQVGQEMHVGNPRLLGGWRASAMQILWAGLWRSLQRHFLRAGGNSAPMICAHP